MHIKLLYRKVLYVFLSLMIVISSTQSASAATSVGGWTALDTITAGATNTINAVKGAGATGMRSAVAVAPSVVKVGKHLIKGGGAAALLIAVPQILGDGVDWVLDPANNSVKYTVTDSTSISNYLFSGLAGASLNKRFTTPRLAAVDFYAQRCAEGAASYCQTYTFTCPSSVPAGATSLRCGVYPKLDGYIDGVTVNVYPDIPEKSLPISEVAAQVIANAEAGNSASQEAVKYTALEGFVAGDYDTELNAAAVPDSTVPADPTSPDTPAPFDPSSIIAAIKSVMSAITNMSSSIKAKMETMLVEIGVMQQETNQVINDGMADVVAANQATEAKVGDVVAAIEALEGNTLTGEVINDAVDRVIAEGKTNTSDIVAAIEAIEGNTLDGQVINDAVDRVIANDNVNAQAAADAATAAADAAKAADAANTAAVTDAIGAQADAMTTTDPTTGEKSLKLPAFCGFAPVVCDYITWVKGEYQTVTDWVKAEPETMPDDPIVVADDPSGIGNIFQDKAEAGYVSFESQCPNDVLIPVSLMGASQTLTISYTPFCHFASLIRYAVILGAWISGLLIVTGGRSRE